MHTYICLIDFYLTIFIRTTLKVIKDTLCKIKNIKKRKYVGIQILLIICNSHIAVTCILSNKIGLY